jgi:hypothetical protein
VFGITMVSISNQMASIVTEPKSMIKTMSVAINKLHQTLKISGSLFWPM